MCVVSEKKFWNIVRYQCFLKPSYKFLLFCFFSFGKAWPESLPRTNGQIDRRTIAGRYNLLVSWYFEPSQPQRVTSWLKTMFSPSPIYSARKSSNHKLSINHKISHDTNLHKTKHTQKIGHKIFEELVPSVSPLLKKHIRLGHAGIVDHSVNLSIPDLKKKYKKRMDRSNKKF